MKVCATTNFDGAIRELRGTSCCPDVALIDLRTLGKDWRARAAELNRMLEARGSTAVASCAHKHEISELAEAGIRVYVEKPIRRAKIIAALLQTVNRGSARQPVVQDARRASLPAPPPRTADLNGMKILVAEDNEINQKVVQAHLHALGYEVDLVPDGRAALQALEGPHGYAAVIMDGQMPHMDGYEATRIQRARELEHGRARVPIIALTAHAMTGDRRTAFAAGMDDYLSKPFTQRQLRRALARWVAGPAASLTQLAPDGLDTTITSQLLELEEEEPGFLCEVIDSFLSTAEQSIDRMRDAIERADLQALRAEAHMIRGSGQQLGARRIGATCCRLEGLDSPEHAVALVSELERDLEGAREALTRLADRALDAAS